jgi:hypothetical protein
MKYGKGSCYDNEYATGTSQTIRFLVCDVDEMMLTPAHTRLQIVFFLQRASLSIFPYPDQFHRLMQDYAADAQRKIFVKEKRIEINSSTFLNTKYHCLE